MILARAPRHGISEAFEGNPGAAVVEEVLHGAELDARGIRLRIGPGGMTITRGRHGVFNYSGTAIKPGSLMQLEEVGGRLVVVAVGFPAEQLPGARPRASQASA